jgi:hypothetical protein
MADFVEKVVESDFGVGADACLRKPPYSRMRLYASPQASVGPNEVYIDKNGEVRSIPFYPLPYR